jgi:hypothetical protein
MSAKVIHLKQEKPVKNLIELSDRCREMGGGEDAGNFLEELHMRDEMFAKGWHDIGFWDRPNLKFLPRLQRRGFVEAELQEVEGQKPWLRPKMTGRVRLSNKGRVKGKFTLGKRCPHCGSWVLDWTGMFDPAA